MPRSPVQVCAQRGVAAYVEWLSIPDNPSGKGWAAGSGYGERILAILEKIAATEAEGETGNGLDELAALRAEIEQLQAENARLCNIIKDAAALLTA